MIAAIAIGAAMAAIPGCRRSRPRSSTARSRRNRWPHRDGLGTGTLQPLTQVDISSELSGVVRTVAVDENDLVHKGDVLPSRHDTAAAQVDGRRRSASGRGVDDARTT
jgi:multidrug efflux pump subunit AcrA (membrane-fusion protein)